MDFDDEEEEEYLFEEGDIEEDDDDDEVLDEFEEMSYEPTYAPRTTGKRKTMPRASKKTSTVVPIPQMPSTGQGTVFSLARAIQHHEGWFPPGGAYPKGSQSYRNNNPGNLRYIGQRGATGRSASGFAIFPDYATGWAALLGDLRAKLGRPPTSIRSILSIYAPPSENDTGAYIQAVADELGISPDARLS